MNKKCKDISRYETKHNTLFNIKNIKNIKNILSQNEAYTKLLKWFYNCNILCTFNDKFKYYDEYINYYSKHIVLSCSNPIDSKGEKIKSCRKPIKKKNKKTKTVKQ
jgi:hypothetical protein